MSENPCEAETETKKPEEVKIVLPPPDDPMVQRFLAQHRTRVSVISLQRRPDRWGPAEENARRALEGMIGSLEFVMFAGTDAHAHKALLPNLDAIEEQLNMKVYRDWAITETSDVRRAFQLSEDIGEVKAWMEYEQQLLKLWNRTYASRYIDYFNRHMTLGECGSTLSHLRVLESAVADQVEVQVIFEDDARPHPLTLPVLFHQIQALARQGIPWDLIYLRSSKYSLDEEDWVPGTILTRALHRKCVDAYAVSRSGALKVSQSGFRQQLFPIDDFLPALHSPHPRPDIRALACVRGAQGLQAFAFPSELPASFLAQHFPAASQRSVCELAQMDSDNNKSPCVLGDHGAETEA